MDGNLHVIGREGEGAAAPGMTTQTQDSLTVPAEALFAVCQNHAEAMATRSEHVRMLHARWGIPVRLLAPGLGPEAAAAARETLKVTPGFETAPPPTHC